MIQVFAVWTAFVLPDRVGYLPDGLLSRHRRPPSWLVGLEIVKSSQLSRCSWFNCFALGVELAI
jgi:hypothetical protein